MCIRRLTACIRTPSALAAVLLAGCSESGTEAAASPAADAGASNADAAVACVAPTESPAWLEDYLREGVAKLSGATEIVAGARIADREGAEGRKLARDYLVSELASLGFDAATHDYATGANAIGRLPANGEGGTQRWIVLGAHFDGVAGSPGANDNASGVVAVLAVARMLRDLPCRREGIIVAMFDEEEIGLVGSKAFADRLVADKTDVVAVHSVDQVGWDSDGDNRFELELPTSELLEEYRASAEVVGASVVRTSTDTSDHQSFRALGMPAVGITEEYVNRDTSTHAHRSTDTADTINTGYQALAVRLVAHVVARELGAE